MVKSVAKFDRQTVEVDEIIFKYVFVLRDVNKRNMNIIHLQKTKKNFWSYSPREIWGWKLIDRLEHSITLKKYKFVTLLSFYSS